MSGRQMRLVLLLLVPVLLGAGRADAEPPVIRVEVVPASLAGGWEFAPGDPPGGVLGMEVLAFRPVAVPGPFQAAGVPAHGTGWYRVGIELSPELTNVALAFACHDIRDADEVYFDGLLVGRTGGFPPEYDRASGIDRVYGLPPSRTALAGRHVLAVKVHNPGPGPGGLMAAPRIETLATAFHGRVVREGPRALLAATFAALGLFSLFTFLRDRHQLEFLSFFLSSAAAAILTAAWLSYWAVTDIPLSLVFRVAVASTFCVPAMTLLLFLRFFERPSGRLHRVLLLVLGAGGLGSLLWPRVDDLVYALPLSVAVTAVVAGDLLVFLVNATRRHAPYARSTLVATVLVVLAGAHDAFPLLGFAPALGIGWRLSGPAYFVLMSTFLAAMADRLARLRLLASTDPLTGLANRAVLFDRINLELARARRHGHPVALAILDLDHFKAFNDRFGHVAGDRLLVGTARAMMASIRDTDLAVRFGGEEFVVLLPEADSTQAIGCLERIRAAVAQVRVSGTAQGATVSAGVALFDPSIKATVSVTAWLRQADSALYAAKAGGRNRVKVAEGAPPGSSSASGALEAVGLIRRTRPSSTSSPALRSQR